MLKYIIQLESTQYKLLGSQAITPFAQTLDDSDGGAKDIPQAKSRQLSAFYDDSITLLKRYICFWDLTTFKFLIYNSSTESPTTAAESTTQDPVTITTIGNGLIGPDGAAASTSEDSGGLSSMEVGT